MSAWRSIPARASAPLLNVEPMTGIEPAYSAWEADVLPLNYIGVVRVENSKPQPIDSATKVHSSSRTSTMSGIDTLSRRSAR